MHMKMLFYSILFLLTSLDGMAKNYTITKDIPYVDSASPDYDSEAHRLDVYVPKKTLSKKSKVLLFIHGGAWKKGTKDSPRHTAVGEAFAFNGVVTVVMNYRLAPTKYYDMADDCARALVWVKNNIARFGGNEDEVYLSGHSAGAHLAALIATDSSYVLKYGLKNPIKGCVMNDPFGLNMFTYLAYGTPVDALLFNNIFTDLPTEWQKGSPYYHIDQDGIKYYTIYGSLTMSHVKETAVAFHERNRYVGNLSHAHEVRGKNHISMVNLFCRKRGQELQKVLAFMQ